jgi:hypothetical protein
LRSLRGLIWGTKLHVAAHHRLVTAAEGIVYNHSQYPSLDLRHGAFGRRQVGLEERGETTILVGAGEQAVMLGSATASSWPKSTAPQLGQNVCSRLFPLSAAVT